MQVSLISLSPHNEVIPPSTLLQAGDFSVCHSAAWNEKIVTSAWWVEKDQVSKTAPSGEFLTTGSFMIRGKKNYLPPSNLILGFGIMFKLHEESIAKHKVLRKQTQDSLSDTNMNNDKEEDTELQVDETDSNENESGNLNESGQISQIATVQLPTETKSNDSDQLQLRSLGFGVQHSDDIAASDVVESDSVGKKVGLQFYIFISARSAHQLRKGDKSKRARQIKTMKIKLIQQ